MGTEVILSGAANGSLPLSYQWRKDGVDVPGATASMLTLPSAYFSDSGSYVLWVTNGVGFTNTTVATVTILAEPTFANLTNDLVLHLRFDGDYLDTSGRNNDAFPAGITQPGFVGGKIGQGVHIATTPGNNYLQVLDGAEDLSFDETTSFSIAFWVNYTTPFNDVPIMGNAVNSTSQLGWVFTDSASPGRLEWSLASTANTDTYLRDPVGPALIGDGTWHHVLGVVDRQKEMAFVYVDGALTGSWSIAGLGTLATPYYITIGQDPNGYYGTATFDLDDLGIWRHALTAYDAAAIYGASQFGNSFDVYGPVKVSVKLVGTNVDVSWQAGTLLESASVNGTYTPVQGATPPFYRATATGEAKFFRVEQ